MLNMNGPIKPEKKTCWISSILDNSCYDDENWPKIEGIEEKKINSASTMATVIIIIIIFIR